MHRMMGIKKYLLMVVDNCISLGAIEIMPSGDVDLLTILDGER